MSVYGPNTNWDNEELYLNNLIAQGGGNAAWAQNQLGVLHSARQQYDSALQNTQSDSGSLQSPINFNEDLGSFQNAIDLITHQADETSARNLEYAQQNQEWSAEQAAIARGFNAEEAAKNRAWQEYMSNTAHQREIADLKAAGLNPILSAMNGNGAAVTSGASASASVPSGASAQADQSRNSALVSLLGSMLGAQTSITNQLVSAKTQESVAEKYTAMSYLTAQIAAAASMSNAGTAAAASMYGSDMAYRMRQDFPESLMGVLNSWLTDNGYNTGNMIDALFNALGIEPGTNSQRSGSFGGNRSGSFGGKSTTPKGNALPKTK